jgi:hypothetical protein
MLLGAVSLVLWFGVSFGLAIAWQVNDDTPARQILTAGGIGLLAAALPWLGYSRLVSRLRRSDPEPRG